LHQRTIQYDAIFVYTVVQKDLVLDTSKLVVRSNIYSME